MFVMTDKQLALLLDASKPVPYLIFGGVEPLSPQENANRAWSQLGTELGFDYLTVKPAGLDAKIFTAEALTTEPVATKEKAE
jgi:hypothetical protein